MTRNEEIKQQADIYTDDASNYAEWSDDGGWTESNDIELIEKAFIESAKWADRTLIEKACEWLESALKSDLGYYGAVDFANTFRKVMEE